jgi:hypothetical protein
VVDLQETPAVPPFDAKGDERYGYYIAGSLLIAIGWGVGVITNVLLHLLAPSGGTRILGLYFGTTLGPYAWATLALGLATGVMGVWLIVLARDSPKGELVFPGYEY